MLKIFGIIASCITISMFLPQTIKIIRFKKYKNLNFLSFFLYFIGITFWYSYGSIDNNIFAYIASVVVAILTSIIIYFLLKDKNIKLLIFLLIIQIIIFFLSTINIFYWKTKFYIEIKLSFAILGGIFTSISFYPQAFEIIRNKSIGDFSIITSFFMLLNIILWIIFWILKIIEKESFDRYSSLVFTCITIFPQLFMIYIHFYYKLTKKNHIKKS